MDCDDLSSHCMYYSSDFTRVSCAASLQHAELLKSSEAGAHLLMMLTWSEGMHRKRLCFLMDSSMKVEELRGEKQIVNGKRR